MVQVGSAPDAVPSQGPPLHSLRPADIVAPASHCHDPTAAPIVTLFVALAQVQSVSVSATFTVLEGQVSSLTWEFVEYAYAAVSFRLTLHRRYCACCDHLQPHFALLQARPL